MIKSVSSVDLLGIQDYKLSFNLRINNIYKSGVDQLIMLIILTQFPSFHAKKFLIANVFLLMILMLRTKSYLQKEESAQCKQTENVCVKIYITLNNNINPSFTSNFFKLKNTN